MYTRYVSLWSHVFFTVMWCCLCASFSRWQSLDRNRTIKCRTSTFDLHIDGLYKMISDGVRQVRQESRVNSTT